MTGNTVLLGGAIVAFFVPTLRGSIGVALPALSLAAFVGGAWAAARFLRAERGRPPLRTSLVLSLLAVMLAVAAALRHWGAEQTVPATVALLSAVMGAQSVVAVRAGVTGVTTTFVTGTLVCSIMALAGNAVRTEALQARRPYQCGRVGVLSRRRRDRCARSENPRVERTLAARSRSGALTRRGIVFSAMAFATLKIGPIEIWPPLILAPMSGVTNRTMRALYKPFGLGLTVTEFVSANALEYGSRRTMEMIDQHGLETAGFDPVVGRRSARHGARRQSRPRMRCRHRRHQLRLSGAQGDQNQRWIRLLARSRPLRGDHARGRRTPSTVR